MPLYINGYDSVDIETEYGVAIDQWKPDDPNDVDVWVNFAVGESREAQDMFLAHIVTHQALKHADNKERALITMETYSWEQVLEHIQTLLNKCEAASDWYQELSKHLISEYDR